ncbi:hypothetical protein [Niabella ginsengisoli]|uniref:Uncharacterized protein n=1 Tax=Niabella ginsengisoli TaxID=522298 RepID=A0ABS9SHF7_9BACT|nr:hypothetical protein [Niabella ginsengisoli]MCH5597770.1 hypothetical protein [Niabella ginsengisoli]
MNAVTDLTDVYKDQLKSAKRGVAIIKGKYAIVRDEVKAKDKSFLLRWTMMTTAAVKIDDQNTVTLTKGGKKLIMKIRHSRPISIKQWPTTPENDYDAANPGTTLIGFEAEVPPNEQASFDVFLCPAKNKNSLDYKVDPLTEWPKD